uniref:Uncharacterized protein n=1 Tax=Anopheles atroparvus TaxID=41427 RepID=A0A182IXG3_ANOAO
MEEEGQAPEMVCGCPPSTSTIAAAAAAAEEEELEEDEELVIIADAGCRWCKDVRGIAGDVVLVGEAGNGESNKTSAQGSTGTYLRLSLPLLAPSTSTIAAAAAAAEEEELEEDEELVIIADAGCRWCKDVRGIAGDVVLVGEAGNGESNKTSAAAAAAAAAQCDLVLVMCAFRMSLREKRLPHLTQPNCLATPHSYFMCRSSV